MRLIDADVLYATLKQRDKQLTDLFGDLGGAASGAAKLVLVQPTVDAVEVVKCRDCRYWKTGEDVNRSKKVKFCTYAIYHSYARRDEDFCSRGERKDGDRHD